MMTYEKLRWQGDAGSLLSPEAEETFAAKVICPAVAATAVKGAVQPHVVVVRIWTVSPTVTGWELGPSAVASWRKHGDDAFHRRRSSLAST